MLIYADLLRILPGPSLCRFWASAASRETLGASSGLKRNVVVHQNAIDPLLLVHSLHAWFGFKETLWDGILALFLSQLGQLVPGQHDVRNQIAEVLLVMSCTVQLRMYSSRLFGEYKDVFVEEPEDVILARAQ